MHHNKGNQLRAYSAPKVSSISLSSNNILVKSIPIIDDSSENIGWSNVEADDTDYDIWADL